MLPPTALGRVLVARRFACLTNWCASYWYRSDRVMVKNTVASFCRHCILIIYILINLINNICIWVTLFWNWIWVKMLWTANCHHLMCDCWCLFLVVTMDLQFQLHRVTNIEAMELVRVYVDNNKIVRLSLYDVFWNNASAAVYILILNRLKNYWILWIKKTGFQQK